ncbi:hypothetical protein ABPG74_000657 [Tetrahymena malaccensis]
MFVFLSKKIGMPNNAKIEAVCWNKEQGWIAAGGEKGILKVLKIEDQRQKDGSTPTQTGQLLVNNTLEYHTNNVYLVTWNDRYRKLTSVDESGIIVVWAYYRELQLWKEEMINDRKKSVVRDLKWSPDGQKVCIAYEDGAVIVGSVEGSPLWRKEFPHKLALIEWSPDSKMMIFGTPEGEVRVYDSQGMEMQRLKIHCLQKLIDPSKSFSPDLPLAAIDWFPQAKMYTEDTPPGLCIAYQCGRVQLMKNEKDDEPVLIDTMMKIFTVKWNPSGSMFAISGTQDENGELKGVVQFYSNAGHHLKTLRVPSTGNDKVVGVSGISWEGSGLRIAMAVNQAIFFANIKPDHKWAYMSDGTLAFAYQKIDRVEYTIIFWDTINNKKNLKFVKNLCCLRASGDLCCIITELIGYDLWQIDLCNSIGSPIDSKQINIYPNAVTMTKTHIIVCSQDHVYAWQYKNQVERLTTFEQQTGLRRVGREQAWFIDKENDSNNQYDKDTYDVEPQSEDVICTVAANENFLLVARISGTINVYTFPHISLENKLHIQTRPSQMSLNKDATRLAIIDHNGTLNILKITPQGDELLPFEKKECWFVKYSEDIPESFVFMERSRMYIVNDQTAEDPIITEGYICQYKDFQVKIVYLDDIMKSPDGVLRKEELTLEIEANILKDIKDQLYKKSMQEMFLVINKHNNHCLWRVYAKKALEDNDFDSAENAFVQCQDYASLKFLQRIRELDDRERQRAEIQCYFNKVEEAEEIYNKIERRDLSIQMRMKLGDWAQVVDQIREGTGQDVELQKARLELGNYYAENFQWEKAAKQYALAKYNPGLIEAYTRIQDYESLEKLIAEIPERNELLQDMGDRFQQAGLCDAAVRCYEKFGDIKQAIDCCVLLNHWNLAVELAEQYNFVQIEGLLVQYANQLLEKRRKLEAAELYRKAKRNTEAAKILSQIADDLTERDANPLNIKKMYVMAALEVDLYKKRMLDATMTGQATSTAKTLNSLITSTINTSSADKILNNPWRGAEAWHFFILAQRQLYTGQFKYALKAALRLGEYELEIDQKKIYSLIAIAAYYNKSFRECSRAFVKLQNLENITEDERERYEAIAVSIFTKHPPIDSPCEYTACVGKNCTQQVSEYDIHCRACGSNFSPCVASGRPIFQKEFYQCKNCRHKMIESEVQRLKLNNCALCHSPIDLKRFGVRDANL